ncbi:hypothetical protein VCRLGP107_520005 [Vibrio crassostreae]|nr:hypothetical protein VCRLGP107_520005 [Vibrio crassostreae]
MIHGFMRNSIPFEFSNQEYYLVPNVDYEQVNDVRAEAKS